MIARAASGGSGGEVAWAEALATEEQVRVLRAEAGRRLAQDGLPGVVAWLTSQGIPRDLLERFAIPTDLWGMYREGHLAFRESCPGLRLRVESGPDPLVSVRLQIPGGGLALTLLHDLARGFPDSTRLLVQLPPHVAIDVIRRMVARWGIAEGRITFATSEFGAVYARDNAKAATVGEERVLFVPRAFRRGEVRQDEDFARVAGGTWQGRRIVVSRLYWEGGDLLVGARHALIGYRTVRQNRSLLGLSAGEVIDAFEREFAKPVLVLGGEEHLSASPGHIDANVALLEGTGAGHALVAEPEAGARLAAATSSGRLRAVLAGQHGTHAENLRLARASWGRATARRRGYLDAYAERLAREGYGVVRVPDLEVLDGDSFLVGSDIGASMLNGLPDGQARVFYLFRYGFDALERELEVTLAALGWRVAWMNRHPAVARWLLQGKGGLRCVCGEWD